MRTYSLVALLVLILALAGVQSLPACSTTTCSTSADCPRHTDNLAPICSRGRCTTGPPVVKIHIGDNCDIYSPISQCDEGLVCSSAGLADGQAVCQYPIPYGCNCETDDQCDGGRCKAGHCDPIHSIGDLCTEDDQCGSVCVKGMCAAGPVGAKCNKHISCVSGFCADNSTCQTNPKGLCGAANPYGACADAGAFCYDGTCYTSNGGIGAVCNSSVPAPMCKDTLGCVDGKCQIIPEGQSCSSRRSCSALQDCVCGENRQYGCYTLVGLSCTSAYQDYLDCINSCSEPLSESMPDSCAHECRNLKSKYSCCIGCASDSTLYNVKGNCPDTAPQLCCSATQACSTLSGDALCGVSSNDTVPSTPAPTSPPTSIPTSPPSSPPSSSPSFPPSPRPSSSPSTGETDPEQNNPSAASRFSPSVALLGVVMAVASAVL